MAQQRDGCLGRSRGRGLGEEGGLGFSSAYRVGRLK